LKRRFTASDIINSQTYPNQKRIIVTEKINIGICAHCFSSYKSGIGRYAWELFLVLYNQLPNATFYLYSNRDIDLPIELSRVVLRQAESNFEKKMPVYFWLKFIAPMYMMKNKLNIVWSPTTLSPLFFSQKTIVTVHDLNHILVKETMPLVNAIFFKFWFNKDVLNSVATICNSEGTALRLKEICNLDTDLIVRPAVSETFVKSRSSNNPCGELVTQNKFILAVSTIEPRKNLLALVKAYVKLQTEGKIPEVDLVLVGKKGWRNNELDNFIHTSTSNSIHFTGFVSDEMLGFYYKEASVFVMPSIYEGFGMPVAEALTSGTPVVCTDIPELREAGQNLCTYTDTTPESIANGIELVLNTPSKQTRDFIPFSWDIEGTKMTRLVQHLCR
jgi:glycosyltransferase involved in cell wall biosynthesis